MMIVAYGEAGAGANPDPAAATANVADRPEDEKNPRRGRRGSSRVRNRGFDGSGFLSGAYITEV